MWLLPPLPDTEDNSDWVWPRIFIFFLLWWIFYWALLRISKKEPEYCCRVLTFAHGIFIFYLTFKDIITSEQEFDFYFNTPLTAYQFYFLSITISYFLYDFLWINIFGRESKTIQFHHICSIFLLFKLIWSNIGGPGVSYALFGLEFTNPYLQLRWFLRTYGYQNKAIHKAAEIWFVLSFIVIRVFGGTVLLYFIEIHPCLDIILKILFIGIYIVSLLLTVQIIQFFKKKYIYRSPLFLNGSVLSIFPYRRRYSNQDPYPAVEDPEDTDSD